MSVLEQFKHADTFAQMSFGDKMAATGQVILLGMFVTVSVLVLLWACIAIMSSVLTKLDKSQNDKKAANTKAPVKTEVVKTVTEEDDEELIAVITSAIAASLNTSLHNIVVTNIVRTDDNTPVWGKAGRSDIMNSRL